MYCMQVCRICTAPDWVATPLTRCHRLDRVHVVQPAGLFGLHAERTELAVVTACESACFYGRCILIYRGYMYVFQLHLLTTGAKGQTKGTCTLYLYTYLSSMLMAMKKHQTIIQLDYCIRGRVPYVHTVHSSATPSSLPPEQHLHHAPPTAQNKV